MVDLENTSEILAYGSPKPKEKIKEIAELFRNIEDMIKGLLNEEK